VDDHFDVFDKPLSAVVSADGQGDGVPDYATDGGLDGDDTSPKVVTEADNIRGHVAASGYWEDDDER
jgi:sodium/proline symporter